MKRGKKPARKPARAAVRQAKSASAKARRAAPVDEATPAVASPVESAVESAREPAAAPAATQSRRAGLKLESSCTLRDALDMQFQLLATDFGDSDVLLDGSAVERIDTAGLQMLVAFTRQHSSSGKRVEWLSASAELQRCSRMLGLDEAIGLAAAAGEASGT